jgi:Protein of unknown function (DUF4232)
MNLHASTGARRIAAAAVATCAAAVLAPAAALASPGPRAAAAPAATPSCATSGLDVWLDTQGSAALGTTYYHLEFTNLSGSSCRLFGYPAIAAVTLTGTPLGNASVPSGGTPHTVTLASGATAHAVLGIAEAVNFPPSQCQPVTAAGLQVHPPGQTTTRLVPFPFAACSKNGPIYLTTGPVKS